MKSAWLLLLFLLATSPTHGRAAISGPDKSPSALSLEKCLRIALVHNPQLRLASANFIQTRGQVLQLRAILYPTINVQAFTTPLVIYVQLQQIFYSRAVFPQLRIGHLTEEQAFINYRQTLNDVVFQVRQAFITALAAQARVDLLRDFSAAKAKAVDSSRQLFDAGEVQQSVVFNVQVQANLSRQTLAADELASTQARLLLDNLIGQTLPDSTRLTGDFAVRLPPQLDTSALTAQALQDREDLKLLASMQLAAQQQIEIDTKNALPMLGASSNSATEPPGLAFASSLNAEANYNEPSTQRNAGDSQLPLSLYATWIISDGGNVAGVTLSDRAKIASQNVALADLKESIAGEVASAVAQILTQQDRLKAVDAQPTAQELRQLSQLQYEAGQIRQLDKVNLENDILAQQEERLDSGYRLSLAAAALDHALGHGLKISLAPTPAP